MDNNEMETTGAEAFDFDAFMEADGGIGNHTEPEETEGSDAEETGSEPDTDPEPEETVEEGENRQGPEEGPQSAGDDVTEEPDDTFTIKVNKEEKNLTRDEVIRFAQKGHDYDRVKQQRDESRQEAQSLREQIAKNQEALDLLTMVSEQTKISMPELVEGLYINLQKSKGIDEAAAREALRADKLQRRLSAMEAEKTSSATQADAMNARMNRELAEFDRKYEGVRETIPKEQLASMTPDIRAGMTFTHAYEKMLAAQQLAEAKRQAEELQRQLAAEKQNKKNRTASPGSQKDSGGKTKKDTFDEFMEAFA